MKQNKRICILENNLISVISFRKKLIQGLYEQGYDVTILSTGSDEDLNKAHDLGFKIIDIGASVTNPIDIIKYLYQLYRKIKAIDPFVVFTFTIRPAIYGNIVTRLLGIKTITNITGIGPLFQENHFAYRMARLLYKFVLSKTHKVVFQNQDDKQLFIEKGFVKPENTASTPGSGVDLIEYAPQEKTIQRPYPVFLIVARLIKDKGIIEYVSAAKELKKKYPHATFQILGPLYTQNLKGNTITEEELNQWIEEKNIEYLGGTTDVRPYIANSDCVVLPSYREGLANVLLEASSMGKICVTTNVTGCRDVIQDGYNGFLCEAKNVQSLVEAMEKVVLLDEETYKKMCHQASERVIHEFDKKIVLKKYLEFIHEVENIQS